MTYKIKILIGGIFQFLLMISFASCMLVERYKIVQYNERQITNLPDTFRLELPLEIDSLSGYFTVSACINKNHTENFIIDTKAGRSMYKFDKLEERNAHHWGEEPTKVPNSSGQKNKLSLYYFDDFAISELSFGKPLFWRIDTLNASYKIMGKNVIGGNILELLNWKFDLDNEKLILFGNNDDNLLTKEAEDYLKIKKGLGNNKIAIHLPQIDYTGNFTLDLGSQSEVIVDKKTFNKLREKYPYKKYISKKDSLYFFTNINIQWGNISVPNCVVAHIPVFPRNMLGALFISRFNFILHYRNRGTEFLCPENLYIKQIKNVENFKSFPVISDFGFVIRKKREKIVISYLEVGGIAETAGLQLQDEILSIDNGDFNLHSEPLDVKILKYLEGKQQVELQINRNGQLMDFQLKNNSTTEK